MYVSQDDNSAGDGAEENPNQSPSHHLLEHRASGSTIININIESNCFMCLLFGKLRTIFHFTKSSCEKSKKSAQDWEIIRNFAQFLRNDDRRHSYIILVSGADGR